MLRKAQMTSPLIYGTWTSEPMLESSAATAITEAVPDDADQSVEAPPTQKGRMITEEKREGEEEIQIRIYW
jgi:hypothetical protein